MNNGAFGENFPYSNFHDLNMDWIIKIAKDFLDQYSHIQETIDSGLEALDEKATNLEALLQEWYDTHSEDIANQLADALQDLNNWYTEHETYLNNILIENQRQLAEYGQEVMESIPQDYTILANQHDRMYDGVNNLDLSKANYLGNKYIDANGEPQTENGYNTYKFTASLGDVFVIKYDTLLPFWNALNANLVVGWEYDTEGYIHIPTTTSTFRSNSVRYFFNPTIGEIIIYCIDAGVLNIFITADIERYNSVQVFRNRQNPVIAWYRSTHKESFVAPIYDIGIRSNFFHDTTSNYVQILESDYYTFTLPVKTGDSIIFKNTAIPGLNFNGTFLNLSTKQSSRIPNTAKRYDVLTNGFITVFEKKDDLRNTFLNITNNNSSDDDLYVDQNKVLSEMAGYEAVVFGTSISYRDTSYRPILESKMKWAIDNQAQGNGTIYNMTGHPDILNQVLNYASYSNKEVLILEGFVNDWYSDAPLGTYTDSNDQTVCGCVRHALNHWYSTKPTAFAVVILDHYGRLYNGVDCSPSAQNGSGLTQYQYYEEIAKVCDSLGIPHIDLYKIANMKNAGCLLDDIHPTPFGANRLAHLIAQALINLPYPMN